VVRLEVQKRIAGSLLKPGLILFSQIGHRKRVQKRDGVEFVIKNDFLTNKSLT